VVASQVRLIDENGTMMGVYSSYDAFKIAQDRGLDLIEIAPEAKPPTCKIMDYGKWKYENKKKAAVSKKKQTVVEVKEIQVRPRTDQHDLDVKLRHARRFLLEGDKVKVNLRFMGREAAHQNLGYELLEKFSKSLDDLCLVESPPKREGRNMHLILAPDPLKVKAYEKAHKTQAQNKKDPAAAPKETQKDSTAE
jgi:translation initiation factor IF-3